MDTEAKAEELIQQIESDLSAVGLSDYVEILEIIIDTLRLSIDAVREEKDG